MELNRKHCIACEGNMEALPNNAEEELLGNVDDWEIDRTEVHKLTKTVETDSFMDAVRLIKSIAELAESEQHHPDLHLYYNKLEIVYYTHKVKGLTENDFVMAAKTDDLLRKKNLD